MANINVAFAPNFSKTQTISAGGTSASATLDATDVSATISVTGTSGSVENRGTSGGHGVMRIINVGPNTVFLRWGVGTQTALTTDMPMLEGTIELFTKSFETNTVAAICAGGQTATVYITCGDGQ